MKYPSTELNVDFIGGPGSLTKEEEKAISEFLKAKKLKRAKAKVKPVKSKSPRLKRKPSAVKVK